MSKKYVIVFDFDETLGSFSYLYTFWKYTKDYLNKDNLDEKYLFSLLDSYPLFFKPNLIKLLKFIKNKKIKNICDHILLYTNNNGPNEWVNAMKNYLEYKLKYKLFDKIIRAFEIKGRRVEICRTSNRKSYGDFIKCTQFSQNTQICFLDDVYHNNMDNKNVNYIQVNPYYYNENYLNLENTFYNINKFFFRKQKKNYIYFIKNKTKSVEILKKTNNEMEKELLYTDELKNKIDLFLKAKNKNTTKKNKKNKKKTMKN